MTENFNEEQKKLIEELVDKKLAELNLKAKKNKKATLLVMSHDFDRLMCAFIVANTAAAVGMEVTMFFTFWGLTAIRTSKEYQKKSWPEKMVTWMLPGSVNSVNPSKFSFGGLGRLFFGFLMKKQNIASLVELVETAEELGVEMIACEMSMQVMGVTREELRKNCFCAGASVYLERASESEVSLFI